MIPFVIIVVVIGFTVSALLFDVLVRIEAKLQSTTRNRYRNQTHVTVNNAAPSNPLPPPKSKKELAEEEKQRLQEDLEIIEGAVLEEDEKEDAKDDRIGKYAYRIDEILG